MCGLVSVVMARGCVIFFVWLVVMLVLVGDVAASESRWCYECGTDVEGQPNCEEFALASTWKAFWRECSKESICVKILPAWPTEQNDLATVRGCSPRASHGGRVHQEGCWTHPSASDTITCFCNSDLCNSAHATPPPLSLLQVVLVTFSAFFVR